MKSNLNTMENSLSLNYTDLQLFVKCSFFAILEHFT